MGHDRTDKNLQQQNPGDDKKVLARPLLAGGQGPKAG
jgi:hypothetical protein